MATVDPWSDTWDTFLQGAMSWGPTAGVREAWHRGRAPYLVWVVRVRQPEVLRRVGEVQRELSRELLPVADVHVTVWVAGFPCDAPVANDDVPWSALDDQARRLALVPRGTLQVGRVSSFLAAAVFEVHDPGGTLSALRQALGHSPEVRFEPYLPHVTAGTWRESSPTGALADRLGRWRGLAPVTAPVEVVELVAVDPTGLRAGLTTVASVELAGRAGGAEEDRRPGAG